MLLRSTKKSGNENDGRHEHKKLRCHMYDKQDKVQVRCHKGTGYSTRSREGYTVPKAVKRAQGKLGLISYSITFCKIAGEVGLCTFFALSRCRQCGAMLWCHMNGTHTARLTKSEKITAA